MWGKCIMIKVSAWAVLNLYNFLIAFVLYLFTKRDSVSVARQTKAYGRMLVIIMVLIVGDSLSRGFYNNMPFLFLSKLGTYTVFAFDPLIGFFILEYIDTWIVEQKKGCRPVLFFVIFFSAVNILFVTISTLFDLKLFYYYVGGGYNRGSYFTIRALLMAFMFVFVEAYILHRTRKHKNEESAVIRFFLIPTICLGLLQILTHNIALEYTGIVIYALILYIYVQSKKASVDYLTGLVNRRIFENELDTMIANKEAFSGIMIDVDRFKQINDKYGHKEGDNALTIVSEMIYKTFRKSDIVSRYGGDEFCILTDISEKHILESVIYRFRANIEDFNKQKKVPYEISLSIGYDVFSEKYRKASDFLAHLDERMYVEKQEHHRRV